jgi:uncharacterized protein
MDTLRFSIDQIPPEGLSGERVLAASWFSLPEGSDDPQHPTVLEKPIVVGYHLERAGRDIRLRLKIDTAASMACARCLRTFGFPVEASSRYTFCPGPKSPASKKEASLAVEDVETGTYDGDEIDLSAAVYEQIVLAFPIKPLCHEECRGLCPQCGADLNEGICGCASPSSDPRWEALRRLKSPS